MPDGNIVKVSDTWPVYACDGRHKAVIQPIKNRGLAGISGCKIFRPESVRCPETLIIKAFQAFRLGINALSSLTIMSLSTSLRFFSLLILS